MFSPRRTEKNNPRCTKLSVQEGSDRDARQVQKITASGQLLNNQFRQSQMEQNLYTGNVSQRMSLCNIRKAHFANPGAPSVTCPKRLIRLKFVVCLWDNFPSLCCVWVRLRLESSYVTGLSGHEKERATPSHLSQNSSLRNILLFPVCSPEINNHPSKHGFGDFSMETIPVRRQNELVVCGLTPPKQNDMHCKKIIFRFLPTFCIPFLI